MELGKDLPIIVLNDRKTDHSVAEAYRLGVDDYIAKPCHPAEFLARMRAVLRRRFEREQFMGAEMTIGSVMLDPAHHQCLVRGKPVDLRPREFELLEILMRKVGRVLSRSYLLESIWGMSHTADTRTVDVAVSRLRKALGLRAGSWVETVERYEEDLTDEARIHRPLRATITVGDAIVVGTARERGGEDTLVANIEQQLKSMLGINA